MDGARIHNIYRFPNDYGVSVVSAPRADREARGTYRAYILRYEEPAPDHSYEIVRDTPLTDDYVICQGWDDIDILLQRVHDLSAHDGHRGH